jgi:hypothetical protein
MRVIFIDMRYPIGSNSMSNILTQSFLSKTFQILQWNCASMNMKLYDLKEDKDAWGKGHTLY